ncbi:neprilysin-1-like isoform X1 [Rhipicephalus sanguineus]|uniref:neprilysin-1-like isoform X1 n=1 Tax=Rhipicephalus sanguineus TaxID=34632 RepID=UPI0020C28CA7|nr:neprilysin-1-like isoform X1 [Rhipicephalus sanguineus]
MLYPSAILQKPFYESGLPRAINYGSMGMTIGHEMSHGFDDQGSQFDGDGRLQDWWSSETLEKFVRKSRCFQYQYGNITDNTTGTPLDGQNTLGENIADNGGLRMAFKAFALLHDDTRLEGLNISAKRLFFIAYAMTECEVRTTESLRMQIEYDEHSPSEYRVNVPLKNMQAFSTVFNCSVNAPMNLSNEQRCILW